MNLEEIQSIYDEIALEILNTVQISRNNEVFDLVEIEVYLLDENQGIKDVFIHKNDKQKLEKGIYSHYSGVDICRGGGSDTEKYCGVLIRGISNVSTTIYGPGKIAYIREGGKKNEIDIQEIEKVNSKLNFNKDTILKLPRVNLGHSTITGKKEPSEVYKYLNLKARYLYLADGSIPSKKNQAPAETREVFNALYEENKGEIE